MLQAETVGFHHLAKAIRVTRIYTNSSESPAFPICRFVTESKVRRMFTRLVESDIPSLSATEHAASPEDRPVRSPEFH